jgi:chemotaxis response regulator CheB
MNDITILIADDDPGMRLVMRKLTEKAEGYRLAGEAADGDALIKLYDETHPQVVLMDVEMPGKSGIECARAIQDRDPRAVIVFTDVFEQDEERVFELTEEAKTIGAICFKNDILSLHFNRHSKNRQLYFFTIGENETENVEQSLKLIAKYGDMLRILREHNPNAVIFSLSAFCGAFHERLGRFIAEYNAENGENIHFIDSTGWVPVEPLHPLRPGHRIIAEHLAEEIKKIV